MQPRRKSPPTTPPYPPQDRVIPRERTQTLFTSTAQHVHNSGRAPPERDYASRAPSLPA